MGEEEEEEAKPTKIGSSKKKVEEEEVEDKREHVNIIFIGHVGKFIVNSSCSCELQLTPDNSNLQGKLKKVQESRSLSYQE